MRAVAERLAHGIRSLFAELGLKYAVVQQESIVDFKFRSGPAGRNFDDARAADNGAYATYYRAMLGRGVLLPPSQNEVMFVSTAHAPQDVDETLAAMRDYFCGTSHDSKAKS
jgi:glutamate-1-semialdehyde 2,1-aminomutase